MNNMSNNMTQNFAHLLELIDQQGEVIKRQNGIITKLVNETVEKENYIQTIMDDFNTT